MIKAGYIIPLAITSLYFGLCIGTVLSYGHVDCDTATILCYTCWGSSGIGVFLVFMRESPLRRTLAEVFLGNTGFMLAMLYAFGNDYDPDTYIYNLIFTVSCATYTYFQVKRRASR